MAKAPHSRAVSFNLDDMSSGGLPTDFDAVVAAAVWEKWDYDGKAERPALAVRLELQADEGSGYEDEPIVAHYSAGDLAFCAPSLDGEVAVDLDDPEAIHEGPYIVPVGERTTLSRTSNFADFLAKAKEAGMPPDLMGVDVSALVGMYGHWNRVEQRKRDFKDRDKGKKREGKEGGTEFKKEILALTDFKEMRKPGAKKAGAGASTSKPAAAKGSSASAAATDSDLDDRLVVDILGLLADESPIKVSAIGPKIIKNYKGAEMTAALKRVATIAAEDDRPWTYDAKKGVVALAE